METHIRRYGLLISIVSFSVLNGLAIPAHAGVTVDLLSPTGGWAGTNLSNGTLVKIKGTGFDFVPGKNEVRFTDTSKSQTVKAKVEWAVSDGAAYAFSQTIGYPGTAAGGLDHPWDIAVDDSSGDIYVVDQQNKRIEVFNSGGKFVRMIGTGNLDIPWSVAVDQKGNVYVSEKNSTAGSRIAVFDKSGAAVKSIGVGSLTDPRDLVVDKSGAVYVIDRGAGTSLFVKFDKTGKQIFALSGPTPQPFSQLEGLALDLNGFPAASVYLTDRGTNNVYKYNYLGFYLGVRKIQDLGYPSYLVPDRVAVDWQGAILVQVGDGLIAKLDGSLNRIAEIDLKAAGAHAHMRALDAKKTIYTVDYLNDTLRLFSPADTGELWVRVPPAAKTGPIRVTTLNGSANSGVFTVFDVAGTVSVDRVEVTQGIASYPFVVGKETLVYAKIKGLFGHPGRDVAEVTVIGPGGSAGKTAGFQHFEYKYSTKESVGHFHVPDSAARKPGNYIFRVALSRDGKTVYQKDHPHTFSGTKSHGLVFVRLSDVPNDQWNTKDPFPWFDMGAFLKAFSNFLRVYPIHPHEVVFRFSGDQYVATLKDGVQDKEEVSDLLWQAQLALNRYSEIGFPGSRKAVALVDYKLNKIPGLGGIATPNSDRALIFGLSGSRLVHELGHSFGLVPKNWPSHDPSSKHHSKNFDFVGEAGAPLTLWNSVEDTLYSGSGSGMVATIMNPGGGGGRGFFESIFSGAKIDYHHLFGKFKNTDNPTSKSLLSPENGDSQSTTQKLVMIGSIAADGAVSIAESYLTTDDVGSTLIEEGDYAVAFLGASGGVVREDPFAVSFDLADAGALDRAVLNVVRPFPSETKRVEIRFKDQALTTLTRSKNAPAVSAVTVERQGSSLPVVSWSASDPDGDPLTFALSYSPDGDLGFRSIVSGITGTEYVWDDRLTGGSSNAVVRVEASDGVNVGGALSPAFTIPEKAPYAVILNVDDNATFVEGRRIPIRGVAWDPEDGLLDGTNLKWQFDDRFELGIGQSVNAGKAPQVVPSGTVLMPLDAGSHSILLLAEDSDGNGVSDSVTINVVADSDRDGLSDQLEEACGSDPSDPLSTCPIREYVVKFVCGDAVGHLAAQGRYLTAINLRNPADTTVPNRWKPSLAARYQDASSASAPVEFDLRPNETGEIDCRQILTQASSTADFLTGFVVIESQLELNVVAVYSAAGAAGKVETLHTERVVPEKGRGCPDLLVEKIDRPTWDAANEGSIIRATIANAGSRASPATHARLVDREDAGPADGAHDAVASIPHLAPKASATVTFYLPYWVYNRTVNLEVTADHFDKVSECAENNNTMEFKDKG